MFEMCRSPNIHFCTCFLKVFNPVCLSSRKPTGLGLELGKYNAVSDKRQVGVSGFAPPAIRSMIIQASRVVSQVIQLWIENVSQSLLKSILPHLSLNVFTKTPILLNWLLCFANARHETTVARFLARRESLVRTVDPRSPAR